MLWLSIISLWSVSAIAPISTNVNIDNKNLLQTGNIVFAVIGDYGLASQNEADVANLVKSWNPAFIVTVGDNNYPNGAASTIDENIGQYYHDYIFPYNGKYGAGAPYKRFFPALGNHDWGADNGARQYFKYFSFYNEKGYYDFINGPVHFFIIDSDQNEPDGTSVTSQQAKWLKNGLAASTSAFNIVVMHHPPYSSGRHGSTSYMQWPFKTWGADAVLSGHDHLYERILVDGFPYFVNGVGGAELYYFNAAIPGSQIRFNQDYGAMRVEANSQSMKFQFFTRTGILIDEYTIGKIIPSVASIVRAASNPSNAAVLDFSVTFSEPVTGVDVSDFNLIATNISGASINSMTGSGNTYNISVNTGSGDGTLRLDLIDNDSIVNASGNTLGDIGTGNGNFTNGEAYSIDKTAPSVTSIVRAGNNPTNSPSVDFTITFSEPVTGVDVVDFSLMNTSLSGAMISSLNGLGNMYTISVNTGSGDSTVRLDLVDDDSITDLASNKLGNTGIGNGNFINGETYIVDKTVPVTTSITRANPDPSSASSVDFIVSFSEPVTGVDLSDFNLSATNNGISMSSVNGTGNSYVVSVNTGGSGNAIRLDLIDDDSILDFMGNNLGGPGTSNGNFIIGEIYTIIKTAPSATSIIQASQNPSNAANVDFIVTFSESVTGVDLLDFSLATNISGASIINVSSVDPFYIVTVNTGVDSGNLRVDLIDNDSIVNQSGNPLGTTGMGNGNFIIGETYTIDKTAPIVTSIIRANSNPTSATSVDFIVTFSESVRGVDSLDFNINAAGISNASIINVNNVDPFYVVTVNSGTGTGILRLDLTDDDSISDSAGNKLGKPGAGNGNFLAGESYNVTRVSVNFPAPSTRGPKNNFLTHNPVPAFSWTKIRDASAYEIVIASDRDFAYIVSTQILNGLSHTGNAPFNDGIYYWQVRAYNQNFQPGKFSATSSFTIDTTPPPAPILVSPANNIQMSRRPVFSWNKISGAAKYYIEIDNNPDFSSPEWASLKEGTTHRVTFMRAGTYFWRVRAKDLVGNWGDWSAIFTLVFK